MQLEIRTFQRELLGHAQDRRNTDAAAKQQCATAVFRQWKQIARFADA